MYDNFIKELTFETSYSKHQWAKGFTINVSLGLEKVVNDFLSEIAEVFDGEPEISYLRVIEEIFGDIDSDAHLYRRKLKIFIEAKDRMDARDEAIQYCVTAAYERSLKICFKCGLELKHINLNNPELIAANPFLPKEHDGHFRNIDFCMICARNEWDGVVRTDEIEALKDDKHSNKQKGIKSSALKPVSSYEAENLANIEKKVLEQMHKDQELNKPPKGTVTLFNMQDVDDLLSDNASASANREQVAKIKGNVTKIKKVSYHKKLVSIPRNWFDYCEKLEAKYPNFHDVVFFLKNQFALSARGLRTLSLPPILLVGGPGIGKSDLVITLANDLGTLVNVIDMGCAQTGSALTGSEAYWSNSAPGLLFKTLTQNEMSVANPIFILDELDKVKSRGDQDPLAGLHQLLESRQAQQFHDLSLPEITLDTSYVMYFATANSIDTIPQPILDRFTVFNIADPDHEQMLAIVGNQHKRFLEDHPAGHTFKSELSDSVRNELASFHPRKVRRLLEQAFGLAALADRDHLTVIDIQDVDTGGKKRNASIGFMSPV